MAVESRSTSGLSVSTNKITLTTLLSRLEDLQKRMDAVRNMAAEVSKTIEGASAVEAALAAQQPRTGGALDRFDTELDTLQILIDQTGRYLDEIRQRVA